MEFHQIRSFVTVAETGHVTRAAERLHISQPALSAHIKALESALDLELFERRPSGMALTPAGQRLLVEALKVIDATHRFRDEASAIKGNVTGVVTVGTVSDPQFIRVAELMTAAVERFPRLEIRFHHEVSGAAFEKVRTGELDASFYYGDLADRGVAETPLREITYRIVAPAAWQARIENASWAEIAAEPWILTPPISTHHQIASGLFRRENVVPTKVVEADDEFVVSSLVESGLGMGLMRQDLAQLQAERGTICLWGDVKFSTTLKFIHLESRQRDPAIGALRNLLQDVWALRADHRIRHPRSPRPRPSEHRGQV